MAIKQRTPLIKPRNQGGTFYTFGSALEDIGLNISETNNKVSISHYMMLDIPDFGEASENPSLVIDYKGDYTDNPDTEGDYIFAEYFQNAILNMETVLRNQIEYNFASPHTVSERVFWKWLFKDVPDSSFITEDNVHYYVENPLDAYAKCFGRIVSGSQRVDSEGIYNETFVQIPSSYGQMRVLFKQVSDENYAKDSSYYSSNEDKIEGIQDSEIQNNTIKETGIDARGIFDDDSSTCYTDEKFTDMLEAVIDLNELSEYYNRNDLTYDDLGFGDVDDEISGDFKFNAILVYYSVYDSTGNNLLSTNAFGVYLLGSALKSGQFNTFTFPEFDKRKSTVAQSGTSFSFRINVKPTSAYSGDITLMDNSTTAFAESTDFNDVIKNLSVATEILKTNARTLSKIVDDNSILKDFAKTALSKVDDIEKTVSSIKDSSVYDMLLVDSLMMETKGDLDYPAESISEQILKNTVVTFNSSGEASITINTDALGGDAKQFAKGMIRKVGETSYYDATKFLCLLLAKTNLYKSVNQ